MSDLPSQAAHHIDSPQPFTLGLRVAVFLLLVAIAGTALLATVTLLGPTTVASLRTPWLLTLLVMLMGTTSWWAGYLWLLRRLMGWDWGQGLQRSAVPLAILCLSLPLALAPFLTGKLPYTLVFDAETQSLYLWRTSSLLGAVVLGQELTLIHVCRSGGLGRLAWEAWNLLRPLPTRIIRTPLAAPTLVREHPLLLVVLVAGAGMRFADLESHHGGDVDVMLSVTYAILQWPPFGYYEAYRPQPWVYNHLPLFPILLAPTYWLFENLFHWPTVWAAKLQSGLADIVIAVLLYRCARGRWSKYWGAALAATWLLAPWVITADDHAVGLAAAFAVASAAALQRGWLAGLLLALGVATRNEVAFFLFPLAVYFISQRRLSQTVAFLGAFGTTLAIVALPFALYDLEALDYAMRRQIQRDASTEMSVLLSAFSSYVSPGLVDFLKLNPSLLAIAFNLLVSTIAIRDQRPERVLVIAAAGYILTLPLVHQRYIVFLYSLGLFYAARFRDPLVAVLIVAATWPGIAYGPQAMNFLFFGLTVLGLLRIGKANPVVSLKE